MSRYTDRLHVGGMYERTALARLWNLGGYQAIGRGVFTPKGERQIFLFVTRQRLGWMTQYENFLDEDLLFWDGEKGHGSDERIVRASHTGEQIFLFYRDNRLVPFSYEGKVVMLKCDRRVNEPSKFVFQVVARTKQIPSEVVRGVSEDPIDYAVLSRAGISAIDREIAGKSRGIAQRVFRGNLLRLWQGSCAVTAVQEARVLRSSHIKPWAESNVSEKVDHFNGLLLVPNLDALFNEGLISFQNSGQILISPNWRSDDQRRMMVRSDLSLRQVNSESFGYLEFHRDVRFCRKAIEEN